MNRSSKFTTLYMKNIHEEVFEMNYKKRIADEIIDLKTEVFGPINIVGPKG